MYNMPNNRFVLSSVTKARHQAFTLIELLVVVSIISLLIALLLPALAKARLVSYQIKCATQQRQHFMGMTYYANEYKDHLPRPTSGSEFIMANGGTYSSGWPQILISRGYYGAWILGPNPGSGTYDTSFRPMMNTVFNCPGTADFGKTHFDRVGDYSLNGNPGLGWNSTTTSQNYNYHERRINIKRPSDLILLGNGRMDSSGGTNLDFPNVGNFNNNPNRIRRQHNGGGNFTWHDGHVKLMKTEEPALANKLPYYNVNSY
jgi:prepilin-type N-terminal cleavage/methylation domain-containing protein/prepilin-type processing-associated H-X9-DG protein